MRRNGLIALIVVAVAGGVVWHAFAAMTTTPATAHSVRVSIPQGHHFADILDVLEQEGIRFNRFYTQAYAKWRGLERRLQAGIYVIPAHATMADILTKLLNGDVVEYYFTIVEGWSLRQVVQAMKENSRIRTETEDLDEIARHLGVDASAEGWIHPQTYRFVPQTSNVDLLRRGYEHTRALLAELWESRADGFPLTTPYEALILASMVEKEARVQDEQARIAGVFIKRLAKKMRLQSDPTVIYGLGERFSGRLGKAALRDDTPYNTYLHKGLPPTPIAMPGEAALRAVFNPVMDEALYFVAKGDGTHYFSKTYKEHQRAIQRYRKRQQ